MNSLFRIIIGKYSYLTRRIFFFQWTPTSFNTDLHTDCYYTEINSISELQKINFNFDHIDYEIRFSKQHVFCGLFNQSNTLVAYGWLNNSKNHYLGELDLNMMFNKKFIFLYDFYTFESHRGKNFYPSLLQKICARDLNSKLIQAFPNNVSSCKGILKANFKFVGSISGFNKNKYHKLIQHYD